MLVGVLRGLRGKEIFLASFTGMLNSCEKTRSRPRKGHLVVTMKVNFKGETEYKWHMFLIVYVNCLVFEVRKCVERWLRVFLEE